jgi:hypothetical protein
VFDGVVKIRLTKDHPESQALKASIDRTLGVPPEMANDWKSKNGTVAIRYVIARHHFTEKHIQKYLQDPKNFSFIKPFSIHGAHKYLHTVNPKEALVTADNESERLYLQCPNVPKEAVKEEFYRSMERMKLRQLESQKEAENRLLRQQLEAMRSQLTFLHDMVQKLQEQHLDHLGGRSMNQSVASRRQNPHVPSEIELGEDTDDCDNDAYWNEPTDGDWTDNYQSEDDDEHTTSTFHVNYGNAPRPTSIVGDQSVASLHSKSTIVSTSKSVKTLPREIELDNDEDESHESLEEEAFDNRSQIFDNRSHAASTKRGSYRSIVSNFSRSRRRSSQNSRKMSCSSGGTGSSGGGGENGKGGAAGGTYEAQEMTVTDPYGEKGRYTGSIAKNTGMPNGFGRLEYDKPGRWYEGDWIHGRWTGHGRLSNGDGDYYEGGLKNDHKHGRGKMKFADGRTFEGEYRNGQMVQGKMTYQDGSTYSGSWVDGMRHGFGRCVFIDESIYEGEFKEGEFFGHGKMTWNDGGWYEGEWMGGEMHGKGREVRADGSLRHDGDWVKGQPIRNLK